MTDTLHLHASLKSVIKQNILVLDATPDQHARWLAMGAAWAAPVGGEYGWNAATVRFIPSAREISQAEIVASWLVWLGLGDPNGVKRLVAWAHDDPLWRIGERERCSTRTIANRIDRSVAAIMREFAAHPVDRQITIAVIEEPVERSSALVGFDPVKRSTLGVFRDSAAAALRACAAGVREISNKVWIDGHGYMRDGRRMNNGYGKFDERRLAAGR